MRTSAPKHDHRDGSQAGRVFVLTWNSHGPIHYLDAVRGGLWHLRNANAGRPDGGEATALAVVGVKWNPRRASCSFEIRQIALHHLGVDAVSSEADVASRLVTGVELQTVSVKQAVFSGFVQACRVFFGNRLVKEADHPQYENRPVLTFGQLQVGDLIASEHFANGSTWLIQGSLGDRLRRHFNKARITYRAYLTYAKSRAVLDQIGSSEAAVFATEWTYTHEILSRVACERGHPCIYRDSHGYYYSRAGLERIGVSDTFVRPATVVSRHGRPLRPGEKRREVQGDSGHSRESAVGSEKDSVESSQVVRERVAPGIVVVLLHDIRDAQFEVGVNGYRDIVHWTRVSLDVLIRRRDLRVYVKPHPNVLAEHPGSANLLFVENLRRRYGSRLVWINPDRSLSDVVRELPGRATFVTHHGTAGEELAKLGLAVVAAGAAPYGNFNIARFWLNRREYEELLRSADLGHNAMPTNDSLRVVGEAKRYEESRSRGESFERTHDLLGKWVGASFSEGLYAATWRQEWREVNRKVSQIGIEVVIAKLVLYEREKA